MKLLASQIKRNSMMFFKDKGLFFTSLITPAILLVLYVTFLGNVYTDSLKMALPEGFTLPDKLISGFAGSHLISSILSVSAVTVAFCSNMLMVQDKANKTVLDFRVSPVKPYTMAVAYYVSTLITTLIVCLSATAICLLYVAIAGWYLSALDVLLLVLDVVILCFFGVALSSVINFFLSSQGQISAVGTIVSSGYGFICGAYMPISSFGEGLQKVISFLPGTYGTSLVRNHAMQGALAEMEAEGLPAEALGALKDVLDCNLYFFGNAVEIPVMYAILGGATALLLAVYVLLNKFKKVK